MDGAHDNKADGTNIIYLPALFVLFVLSNGLQMAAKGEIGSKQVPLGDSIRD